MDFPTLYPQWRQVPAQFPERLVDEIENMGGSEYFDRPCYGIRDRGIQAIINKYVPGDDLFTMNSVYPLEASTRLAHLGVETAGGFSGSPVVGIKEALDAHRKKIKEAEEAKKKAEEVKVVDVKYEFDDKEPPRVVNPTEGTPDHTILQDRLATYEVTIELPSLSVSPYAAISQKGEGERCKTITVADQQFRKVLPSPLEFARLLPFYPMKGEAHVTCEGGEFGVVLTLYDRLTMVKKVVVSNKDYHVTPPFADFIRYLERFGLDYAPFRYEALSLITTAALQNLDVHPVHGGLKVIKTKWFGTLFGMEKPRVRSYMIKLSEYLASIKYEGVPDVGAEIFRACLAIRPDADLILELYDAREMCMKRHMEATEMIVINPSVKWSEDVIQAGKLVSGYVNCLGRIKPPAVAYIVRSIDDYLGLVRLAAYMRVPVYQTHDPPPGCPIVGGVGFRGGRPGLDVVSLTYFSQLKAMYIIAGGLFHRSSALVGVDNYRFNMIAGKFIRLNFQRGVLMGAQTVNVYKGVCWTFQVVDVHPTEPVVVKVGEIVTGDVFYEGGDLKIVNGISQQALAYAQMVCGFLGGTQPPVYWSFFTTIKAEWRPAFMPLMIPAPSDFVSLSECEKIPAWVPGSSAFMTRVISPPMPVIVSLAYTDI